MRLKSTQTSEVGASTGSSRGGRAAGFFGDQDGATMVMGVFIAALLVGMVYYVWGIGDAVMHRERMQDASDTAAFSAAVMHARGMNMIALLNMIMAALAMVAATMATIASMLGAAFAAATFVCAFCGPWCAVCCEACPYAVIHGIEYEETSSLSDEVTSVVETAMSGISLYARAIERGVPLAAQAKVVSYGTDVYSPVTDFGVMAPPLRLTLPAQDDETNWPCDEKVLPTVRIMSPILVWLWGTASPYMAGGIAYGELYAARENSREWCEDGYFQRVTDAAQTMGNDEYQVQAYMVGTPDYDWTAEGVAVATWGEGDDAGSTYTDIAQMGRVSFAQAEFFYQNPEDQDWQEWLWHMNWRARLRRWRIDAAGAGGITSACGGGDGCGALGGLGSAIEDVVVH